VRCVMLLTEGCGIIGRRDLEVCRRVRSKVTPPAAPSAARGEGCRPVEVCHMHLVIGGNRPPLACTTLISTEVCRPRRFEKIWIWRVGSGGVCARSARWPPPPQGSIDRLSGVGGW